MPTKEKRLTKVVKKASSPTIAYSITSPEYVAEYDKCERTEDIYSGLLWYNKNKDESSRAKYPLLIRDNLAGMLYLRLSSDESKALKGFVGNAVHIRGKNTLENKIKTLLVKEVKQCNGKCNVFKF